MAQDRAADDNIPSAARAAQQPQKQLMKKILILGGSGFLGSHLCEKLMEVPCRATVVTRRRSQAHHLQMLPMVDIAEVAQYDSSSLAPLLAEHDAVVNLVAILHGNEARFDQAHVQLPLALARACESVGQRRVVHVSALGAGVEAPSMYQRSKGRGEALLLGSGLDVSVLRPSVMFGEGDRFLNLFAKLQQVFPVMPLGHADARFQPVWVEDVASAIVRCLADRSTIGQTYEACGPEVYSLRELVRLAGRCAGVNGGEGRPVIGLPDALARLQAWFMELAPGEPLMSRDNLDSMKADNIASGKLPGLQALGIKPATIGAVAPLYLGAQGLRSGLMAKRKTAGRF
ncbi:MAG: complex subunit family protein [Polaromonas sp.]|nr:complex subunit family protein [Polaromonas sp.]